MKAFESMLLDFPKIWKWKRFLLWVQIKGWYAVFRIEEKKVVCVISRFSEMNILFFHIKLTGGLLWKIDQPYLIIIWADKFFTTYLFNTKIQNLTAAAVEIWILLGIITYLLPKFKNLNSTAAAVDFWVLNFY